MNETRDLMMAAALGYQSSKLYDDHHPEDPHGDAQLELCTEMLDNAVIEYVLNNPELKQKLFEEANKTKAEREVGLYFTDNPQTDCECLFHNPDLDDVTVGVICTHDEGLDDLTVDQGEFDSDAEPT